VQGSLCSSECTDCGNICISVNVVGGSLSSIEEVSRCNVILGDLSIQDLPLDWNEDFLTTVFQRLTRIHGVLRLKNNQFLTSLSFLENLLGIYSLELNNNPNLIDARLPSLEVLYEEQAFVSGNPRLCSSRILLSNTSNNDSRCSALDLRLFINVTDTLGSQDAHYVSGIIRSLVMWVDSTVCVLFCGLFLF
jgi:hypothetical protein